jgi:hypothetical protein
LCLCLCWCLGVFVLRPFRRWDALNRFHPPHHESRVESRESRVDPLQLTELAGVPCLCDHRSIAAVGRPRPRDRRRSGSQQCRAPAFRLGRLCAVRPSVRRPCMGNPRPTTDPIRLRRQSRTGNNSQLPRGIGIALLNLHVPHREMPVRQE